MKALPIRGVDPDRRLRGNARRILTTRLAELYRFEPAVLDPAAVTELHDLRIAAKRLRYLCEVLGPAFGPELAPFVGELKDLQELLGDIHDCDVQLPLVDAELARLDAAEAAALVGVARTQTARRRGQARFVADLAAASRAGERPGLVGWRADLRRRREDLHEAFRERWLALRAARWRQRFAAALAARPSVDRP